MIPEAPAGLVGAVDPRERPATGAFSLLSKVTRLLKSIIHFVCAFCCVLMILDDGLMDELGYDIWRDQVAAQTAATFSLSDHP